MGKSKRVSVLCQNPECQKEIIITPSKLARGAGKFCSIACCNYLTPAQRFWNKVDKNSLHGNSATDSGCWLWTATIDNKGYGVFGLPERNVGAHRYSYYLANGEIPKGLLVCHKCDNRPCVNPEHLFLGTVQDNSDDMMKKGRNVAPVGERHGSAKLTATQVLEIRAIYLTDGYSAIALSKVYGVAPSSIWKIVTRENWKHI